MLTSMPRLGWIFGFCSMASLGLPGLAGFWGEFPAILSAYNPAEGLNETVFRVFMVIAALGTVLAAAYLLWMFQRIAFGTAKNSSSHDHAHSDDLHDVTTFEWIAWTPMLLGILVLGILPNLLFSVFDPAVKITLSAFGG
jgi:NADH-quinone oxidoreductase subunit M